MSAVRMMPRDRPRPLVIGFCGLAGSGKSTAAEYLAAVHGFERVRFAGPLKKMMQALGLTHDEIDGHLKEHPCVRLGGTTPRAAMQYLGTDWGRALICPDLWINAWQQDADAALAHGHSVVVDDVRFLNEANAIWARGGTIVRIARAGQETVRALHESEAMRFPWDSTINNPGDARGPFLADVAALFRKLRAKEAA